MGLASKIYGTQNEGGRRECAKVSRNSDSSSSRKNH